MIKNNRGLRHNDSEEFAPGSATAECSQNEATIYLHDCSTYDLMCLAVNLNSALNKVVQLIQKRSGNSKADVLTTISSMRAREARVSSIRKIKYVDLGARR